MKQVNTGKQKFSVATIFQIFLLLACCGTAQNLLATVSTGEKAQVEYGRIDQNLAQIAYAGGELLKYDVSWTGGIKIGEIYLAVNRTNKCADCFEIDATITTSGGIVHRLYPVKDRHITEVRGKERLPFFCEVWQQQGRSYRAHKTFVYDQKSYNITKKKDGDEEHRYQLSGSFHNEFSSFFSSRLMDLNIDEPFIVPTFADEKRNEVVVRTIQKEILPETIFGQVETLKVSPILKFSGLYDKTGDTIIWYSNDECRIPMQIQSKIIIGSLTASLAGYTNERCSKYSDTAVKSK